MTTETAKRTGRKRPLFNPALSANPGHDFTGSIVRSWTTSSLSCGPVSGCKSPSPTPVAPIAGCPLRVR